MIMVSFLKLLVRSAHTGIANNTRTKAVKTVTLGYALGGTSLFHVHVAIPYDGRSRAKDTYTYTHTDTDQPIPVMIINSLG